MKIKSTIILLSILLALPSVALCASMNKGGKHLVQEHTSQLESMLKGTSLNSENRRKLQSYLRRYFDNEIYGGKRQITKLDNPEARKIANTITNSYQTIVRTPGSHKEAAKRYALQAAGAVALYVKPAKYKGHTGPTGVTGAKQVGKSTESPSLIQEAKDWALGKGNEQNVQKTTKAQPKIRPVGPEVKAKKQTQPSSKSLERKKEKEAEKRKSEEEAKKKAHKEDKKNKKGKAKVRVKKTE